MPISITLEENNEIAMHVGAITKLSQQIDALIKQRDQEIRNVNWMWKALVLERAGTQEPPLQVINPESGDINIKFKDGEARWQ